ncbi:MAG: GNAT family N-acetyltransferase [Caldilineaceae bacterium]|nr:GNAT family N-acetyltransferase [Caldilineaceae bacterium]
MITIRRLTELDRGALQRIITGYVAHETYRVRWQETDDGAHFALERTPLDQPYIRQYDPLDDETVARYQALVEAGCSFGAYAGDALMGVALAEPHWWNRSLWVWEFHVAQPYRGQGFGARLMAALVEEASAAGLRTVVCETQNTNAPAVRFYRKVGFRVEGIDLSYYSNEDFPDGEVAIFLKRRL